MYYGTIKDDYKDNAILVTNPIGIKQIEKNCRLLRDIKFYLTTDENIRKMRLYERGKDREEIKKIISDEDILFKDIDDGVDLTLFSDTPSDLERNIHIITAITESKSIFI